MNVLYYLLLITLLGFLLFLFVRNLRLAIRLSWILVKLFVIAFLILLVGSLLGLWRLPPPFAQLYLGLLRLLSPIVRLIVEWVRSLLPWSAGARSLRAPPLPLAVWAGADRLSIVGEDWVLT